MKMRVLLAFAFTVLAVPAFAAAAPAAAPAAGSDPAMTIIKTIYAHIKSNGDWRPKDGEVLTPRLAGLIAADAADAKGEVGRIDSDYWTNAQDTVDVSKIKVVGHVDDFRSDRETVLLTILGKDSPGTVAFYFQKQNGKWLIDDVRWQGKNGYTLSLLLQYSYYGDDMQ